MGEGDSRRRTFFEGDDMVFRVNLGGGSVVVNRVQRGLYRKLTSNKLPWEGGGWGALGGGIRFILS